MAKTKPKPTLAEGIKELEQIVSRLENSDTPIETSLEEFERGIALVRQAQASLADAEQKVQQLLGEPEDADPEDGDDLPA